jgi:hypothetical protein
MIKAKLDILKSIPDDEFRGLAVIDWESWVPIFDPDIINLSKSSICIRL